MTDATAFLSLCVRTAQQFDQTMADLKSISDRIAADSTLSGKTAEAAQLTGRKELTTADFDNYKVCIDLVIDMLNAINGESVPVSVNTGGTVKLGFYKMI